MNELLHLFKPNFTTRIGSWLITIFLLMGGVLSERQCSSPAGP